MASVAGMGTLSARAEPSLNIPPGASSKVQIIDSGARIQAAVPLFMEPPIPGHDLLYGPMFSFLIEQPSSGRKVLFDLALRTDWQKLPPAVMQILSLPGWKLQSDRNVADILQDNGVDVAGGAIEAVIWSHWHFDHIGDMTTFPSSTAVITGAGVQETFRPGYPENPESPLLEADFTGRQHTQLDFAAQPLQLGNFRALDYFGDGSFYLLDTPGHAIGHLCGLARVTSTQEGDAQDTFILMGGDSAHHGGELRPSRYHPLPENLEPSPCPTQYPSICPGHIFEAIHPRKKDPRKKADEPFYQTSQAVSHDIDLAIHTCGGVQEFDGADDVFVIIAHDNTLLDPQVGIEWFPYGTLKNWRTMVYAEKVRWTFLKDFGKAVESVAKA